MKEWIAIPQDVEYALCENFMYSPVSPNGSGNQVVEAGMAPFAIVPSDAQENFVLPIPANLGSAGLTFFPQIDVVHCFYKTQ